MGGFMFGRRQGYWWNNSPEAEGRLTRERTTSSRTQETSCVVPYALALRTCRPAAALHAANLYREVLRSQGSV